MVRRALAFAVCVLCTSACASHGPASPLPEAVALDSGSRLATTASSFKTYYVDGEGPAGLGGTEIIVFDQASENVVKRIAVPSPLHILRFATDVPHHRLYATAYDPGGVESPAIVTVDTTTDTIINTVSLGGQAIPPAAGFAIDPAAQYGFTATFTEQWTKGYLTRVNLPLHHVFGTIPTGDDPSHIVADPVRPYMYVLWGSAQVTYIAAINTKTYALDKLSPITGLSGVFDVTMRRDGSRMYLIVVPPYPRENVRSPVYVVDVASLKVIAKTTVVGGANFITVSPDGSRVFTTSGFFSFANGDEYTSVSYMNAVTNAYVTRFNAEGFGLTSIAFNHDGSQLLVSGCSIVNPAQPSVISVINASTFVTMKRVFTTDNCLQSSGAFSE